MNLTTHEKSLWLQLIGLVITFGIYGAVVLPSPDKDVMPHHIALFSLAVVLLVVSQVAGHIALALLDRRPGTDERTRLIGLKATRHGAWVLATGVFCALCTALVIRGNFVFTHVLLGFWVLAQVVEIASQLVLHRRGA